MRLYNATLEQMDIQCNSRVFKFFPRKSTNVPDELGKFMIETLREKGIFEVKYDMSKEDIKVAAREAMKAYLYGDLRQRIINYAAQHDQFKKSGITLENDAWHNRALRWDKEIRALLNIESPLETELSFLDDTQRKNLGMVVDGLAHVPQDLFSDEQMANMVVNEARGSDTKLPVSEVADMDALDAMIGESFTPEEDKPKRKKVTPAKLPSTEA